MLGAAFCLPLALYLVTLCPSVALVDSGELALNVAQVAPGHPPGFPLYIALGQAAKLLPVRDLAFRLNVGSALATALGLAVTYLIYLRLLAGVASREAAALSGVLSIATSFSVWRWAVVTEVYGLHLLLLSLVLHRGLAAALSPTPSRLFLAALLQTLAASNHLSAILYAPVVVGYVAWNARRELLVRSRLAALAGGWIAGATPYALLPAAARQEPLFNWGNCIDTERLLRHVTGWQYQVNLIWRAAPGERQRLLAENLDRLGDVLLSQGGLIFLVAASIGIVKARRGRGVMPLYAMAALSIVYAISYQIAEDWDAYFYPLYLAAGLGIATAVLGVVRLVGQRRLAVLALVASMPVWLSLRNREACSHRAFELPRHLVRDALDSLPSGALLLTREWQLYAPTLYAQHVEGYRGDVTILDTELMRRSWYYRYIQRIAPDLYEAKREEIASFLEALVPFERSQPFDAERLQRLYHDIINGFLRERAGRAYMGLDMEPGIGAGLTMVPEGLHFRLHDAPPGVAPPWPSMRGEETLISKSYPRAEGIEKVVRLYAAMRANRGVYLAFLGQHSEAREQIEKARLIDAESKEVALVAQRLGP